MVELLRSGQKAKAFWTSIEFRNDEDREAFRAADDIFSWLAATQRDEDRTRLLTALVFPAVLGDMLNCFYEALECSRKGKLTVAFMLLRKPLQESLFLIEKVLVDREDFTQKMVDSPIKLGSQKAGGLAAHEARIMRVLERLAETARFEASYLAHLRYDKDTDDGFDGVCNKAMHLFTSHSALQTEKLNINFIFSNQAAIETQWGFLYSRLPYLMLYIYVLIEQLCATLVSTDPGYIADMKRRVNSEVLLWWDAVEPRYMNAILERFVLQTRDCLFEHCRKEGFRNPSRTDLARMGRTGGFPGETRCSIAARHRGFETEARRQR